MARVVKRTRPSVIKEILAANDIAPSRVLGQNFLVDENILHIILASAHIAETDRVLEIGPGLGVLTEQLIARCRHVVAIEKDARLATYIRDTFGGHPALRLIEGDALDQQLPELLRTEEISHVISNLPYSSGTRILMELIAAPCRPLRLVVMLQSDVAERLAAKPGSRIYGVASIYTQMYYDIVVRKSVSPSCFYPPPDVRSALVEGYRRAEPQAALDDPALFGQLVKWCFSQRRKQIGRILLKAPGTVVPAGSDVSELLEKTGIRPDQRPESIPVRDWGLLANQIASGKNCSG